MDQNEKALDIYLRKRSAGKNYGKFRVISDDGNAVEIQNDEGDRFLFTYTSVTFQKDITTKKRKEDAEGNVTYNSHTENFSKKIITGLYDSEGRTVLETEYNEDTGAIIKYKDSNGKEVIVNA